MSDGPRSLWAIFRWPLAIGLLSLGGLLAALWGDEAWDVLGWLALAPAVVLSADGARRAWRRR